MDDAIDRYCRATEANDIEALTATLSPHVELVSPLSGRLVFRGAEDVTVLATQVYGTMRGLRWSEQFGEGDRRVVIGEGRIGPFRITDAMAFELGVGGRITRIRPHLRPWLATTCFALMLGPKLVPHVGVVAAPCAADQRPRTGPAPGSRRAAVRRPAAPLRHRPAVGRQRHLDVAAGRVGIRAHLVGGRDDCGRLLGILDARQRHVQ
jgi:hypothetical protein